MPQIRTLADAEAVLTQYVPAVKEVIGKDITLERMLPLMKALGNPEAELKVVHIAGTSGKTSTSYYMASLLTVAGKKTGLTVSPHADSVTERLQLDLKPLDEQSFCKVLAEGVERIKNVQPQPTYFELLVGLAYWHFAQEKVDYAVMETGVGGLHDCTNVAVRPDKVCVITDIGFDHMRILGDTLPEISRQKAGIIHRGNQVFMHAQLPEVMEVFKEWCSRYGAHLTVMSSTSQQTAIVNKALARLPKYQQRNWQLAHETYEYIRERDGLPVLTQEQLVQSMSVKIPGRMDTTEADGKTLIMDGAHNEQKTQAFVDSFKQRYPGQQAAVLLSLKTGKEYKTVLPVLQSITSRLIITTFKTSQDLPAVAIDPELLKERAESVDFKNVHIQTDQRAALAELKAAPESLHVITGSFYLLGQLRSLGIQ